MIRKQHSIYASRAKKNIWLGGIMGFCVLLIFLVTLVKLASGLKLQGFDHTLRPELIESEQTDE